MSSRDRLYASLRALAVGASVTSGAAPAVSQPLQQPLCALIENNYNEDFLREIIRRDESCAPLAMQRLILLTRGSDDHTKTPPVPYSN